MRVSGSLAVVAAVLAIGAAASTPAEAGAKKKPAAVVADAGGDHPKSSYYRKKPEVRGYIQRRGGYSFAREDVINTYGDNRAKYGSVNVYRDRLVDRQTPNGPFDHGFFFDSGLTFGGVPSSTPYPN